MGKNNEQRDQKLENFEHKSKSWLRLNQLKLSVYVIFVTVYRIYL
jgi:hypothetical protein